MSPPSGVTRYATQWVFVSSACVERLPPTAVDIKYPHGAGRRVEQLRVVWMQRNPHEVTWTENTNSHVTRIVLVLVHIRTRAHALTRTHIRTHTRTRAHTHTHTHTHAQTRSHAYAHEHTDTRTYMHAHTQTHKSTDVSLYVGKSLHMF